MATVLVWERATNQHIGQWPLSLMLTLRGTVSTDTIRGIFELNCATIHLAAQHQQILGIKLKNTKPTISAHQTNIQFLSCRCLVKTNITFKHGICWEIYRMRHLVTVWISKPAELSNDT